MKKRPFGIAARTLSLSLVLQSLLVPPLTAAQLPIPGLRLQVGELPAVAPKALPAPRSPRGVAGAYRMEEDPGAGAMVIRQENGRIIIDWETFDIGAEASVHFDQQARADWSALNRIHDQNPSRILGRLSADGRLHLINRNGILFGEQSRVNVHSLTASSLNLRNQDFLAGILDYRFENYNGEALAPALPGPVVNQGLIAAGIGGKIFLLGGDVTNQGTLTAPAGQIGLAAGEQVVIRNPNSGDTERVAAGTMLEVSGTPGNVTNAPEAALESDFGLIGLYGDRVVQDGVVRAATSAQKRGQVEIHAGSEATFGERSWTATPVAVSEEKFVGEMLFGRITVDGLQAIDAFGNFSLKTPLERIIHRGVIDAPGGSATSGHANVSLRARNRIYLDHGAVIDVSGLQVGADGSSNLIELQYTGDLLKDVQGQKHGVIRGESVRFLVHQLPAFGSVGAAVAALPKSAMEMSIDGGTIELLTGAAGDVVVRDGARLNISGGGIHYGSGMYNTTKLLAGGRIYDISSAPEWLTYDKILDQTRIFHRRFGVEEKYQGLYFGGAAPLLDFVPSFIYGGKAGRLETRAARLAFEGDSLLASMIRGDYQSLEEMDPSGERKVGSWTLGKVKGNEVALGYEPQLIEVRLRQDPVALGPDFTVDSPLEGPSILSARMIEGSQLRHLSINAAQTLSIDPQTRLRLPAAGSFVAGARRMEHQGAIETPGGTVELTIRDNRTSFAEQPGFVDLQERIHLGADSRIDVSGEELDNRMVGRGAVRQRGGLAGGRIAIAGLANELERGAEVLIASGAVLDVGGGYEMTGGGKVKGGDAGRIALSGATVVADGTLRGPALAGRKGGTLAVHADEVRVVRGPVAPLAGLDAAQAVIAEERIGKFILGDADLAAGGITNLELKSLGSLTVEEGVALSPSQALLPSPLAVVTAPAAPPAPGSVPADAGFARSGAALSAGVSLGERRALYDDQNHPEVRIGAGAQIRVGPGGTIALSGPGVSSNATLEAAAGAIRVAAEYDLHLQENSRLLAAGVNSVGASPAVGQLPEVTPRDGGAVRLVAGRNLHVAEGARIDVSGSPIALTQVGNGAPLAVAARPGSLSLEYRDEATLRGEVIAASHLPNLGGGSYSQVKTGTGLLALDQATFARLPAAGFDDVAFGSLGGILLTGAIEAAFGRRLVLDSPLLKAGEGADVHLSAPWMRLVNTLNPARSSAAAGSGNLELAGTRLDVVGDLRLDGFARTRLQAGRDLSLSDYDYAVSPRSDATAKAWSGRLETGGDLNLVAGRILARIPEDHAARFAAAGDAALAPGLVADYTVSAAGTIATEGTGADSGAVPGGGGSLTLEGNLGVEHRGVMTVPFGTVTLNSAQGAVRLHPGSKTSVAGAGDLHYGTVRNEKWYRTTKDQSNARRELPIEAPPTKGVSLKGQEVVVAPGAEVDLSGGGTLFGYQFQPGMKGTVNPLADKIVIVPGEQPQLPGKAIYLKGMAGLPEGVYTILPEDYAFREDALILAELGGQWRPAGHQKTEQGYDIVGGYETWGGTAVEQTLLSRYSLRKAVDVLREGDFAGASLQAGSGGDLRVEASRAGLTGGIQARAGQSFAGGRATLIALGELAVLPHRPAPSGESPTRFEVDGEALSSMGFGELWLGVEDQGGRRVVRGADVVMEAGSRLSADRVVLGGSGGVVLKPQAAVATQTMELYAPDGRVRVEAGADIHATEELVLATNNLDYRGNLRIDSGALTLRGSQIVFGEKRAEDGSGLYITPGFWSLFSPAAGGAQSPLQFRSLGLSSDSNILFRRDMDLQVEQTLRLEAARIAGDNVDVGLKAQRVVLQNPGSASAVGTLAETGTLSIDAAGIEVGPGSLRTDGFSSVALNSEGDLKFQGRGDLSVDGDLNLAAGRVTVNGFRAETGVYQGGDYRVDAGNRSLTIGGGATAPAGAEGGRLALRAAAIRHGGLIDNSGGSVSMTATGSGVQDGLFIDAAGRILARGNEHFAGGTVELTAGARAVELAVGSEVDVSAGARGEAGAVALRAPNGTVQVLGSLRGAGAPGQGGSLSLDSARVEQFSALGQTLTDGGFDGRIEVRSRGGDLTLDAGQTLQARQVLLTADAGSIAVEGSIDAAAARGKGLVELNAGRDLRLTGTLRATGGEVGAQGGKVRLAARDGEIGTGAGSLIDVGGGEGGRGGEVDLRVRQLTDAAGTGVAADLNGTIQGARRIAVEAVQRRDEADGRLDAADMNQIRTQVQAFQAQAPALRDRLAVNLNEPARALLQVTPGMEVRSAADLTLGGTSALDPTSWGTGTETGVLTLRAGRNLIVEQDLVDRPTPINDLLTGGERDSWAMNLVAGSDFSGADLLATQAGVGTLTIRDGRQVYSESAPIRFASGQNTQIGRGATGSMVGTPNLIRYNVGTWEGDVEGRVGGNLEITAGAIQTATGDIDLRVGGNLALNRANDFNSNSTHSVGSIRTLGGITAAVPVGERAQNYYKYAGSGGDIRLRAAGGVTGELADNAWDSANSLSAPVWSAGYANHNTTEGLATLAGGDLTIRAGGDVSVQAGTFGSGDLRIRAGGNADGRFLARKGALEIEAGGNFGAAGRRQALELFDTQAAVRARGDVRVDGVVNPTLTRSTFELDTRAVLTYSEAAAVRLRSVLGDVRLGADSPFHGPTGMAGPREGVLPGTLELEAGRNIALPAPSYYLAPAAMGNLRLKAEGTIDGAVPGGGFAKIVMADEDPAGLYGVVGKAPKGGSIERPQSGGRLHDGDGQPVEVRAGGDIRNLGLRLPKQARIEAGGDIRQLRYVGQNLAAGDETVIAAGGELVVESLTSAAATSLYGIEHGGPGTLRVQAGGSIDLGSSRGIQVYGSEKNAALGSEGSDLFIIAGYELGSEAVPERVRQMFAELRAQGELYSRALAAEDAAGAESVLVETRAKVLTPFFTDPATGESRVSGAGNLNMIESLIRTSGGNDDLFLVLGGKANIGRSAIGSASAGSDTGLATAAGGALGLVARGDVNVNESRVMTFKGGDILIWSEAGDINAGRGSRAAISRPPMVVVEDPVTRELKVSFSPPQVGSGIRTLTFDPDGVAGPELAPTQGDIYLIAPVGTIDAGEAGIDGARLFLAARKIKNAQNISFSLGSVGVPASGPSAGLGALAGVGSMSRMGSLAEEAGALGPRQLESAAQVVDSFMAKWLDVEVLGFEPDENEKTGTN